MNLENLIPALSEIGQPALRRAIEATWMAALDASPYVDLKDAMQSPNAPGRSLLLHVNEVNDIALWFLRYSQSRFALYPDRDVTLGAAILHDVDKAVIYRQGDDGEISYRPPYAGADHGPKGAEIALACGVPEEIAALVRNHSPFNAIGHLPGTVEGTIIHYSDLAAADFAAVQYSRPPIHERTDIVRK